MWFKEKVVYEHGKASLCWDGDLLIVETKGPFNQAGLQLVINRIKSSISTKGLTLFRRLDVWDEQTLGCPVVIDSAEEMSKWYKDNGCYAVAVVVKNCLQSHIVSKISHTGALVFDDQEEALSWLSQQLPPEKQA